MSAASELHGKTWDETTQKYFQKILIQKRLYGFGNPQFYNGLPREITNLLDDTDVEIPMQTVDKILSIKKYRDFAMRGRQSMNPLTKFGFIRITSDTKLVTLTDTGRDLLKADASEIGSILLRSFLKWQLPNFTNEKSLNNNEYSGVPFVLALKLIARVNELEKSRGNKAVGLQKREFALFATTLTRYMDIDMYAKNILNLRDLQSGHSKKERKAIRNSYKLKFAKKYLKTTNPTKIDKFLKNLNDYGDNAIRYFRLTNFIRIRGGGFYVDIEPSRLIEIDSLFRAKWYKPKKFNSKNAYLDYLCANNEPSYPWETKEELLRIANKIQHDIKKLTRTDSYQLTTETLGGLPIEGLKATIEDLREKRNRLRNESDHNKAQSVSYITKCIEQFDGIYSSDEKNRALMLEYLSAMGLHAFNNAISIKPNYPVGDDNEPTSTAPGGVADIECIYDSFCLVCEVTMLKNRSQWFNEGQPVMRHLRDFELLHDNSYCLFIAPSIHADTAETFYVANTFGYRGKVQKIAPITIVQFIDMLRTLKKIRENGKAFHSYDIKSLLDRIVNESTSVDDSIEWIENISQIVTKWRDAITKG